MPTMRNIFAMISVATLLAITLGACDDDDEYDVSIYGTVVGGPCFDDLDCKAGAFCARGNEFPEGTCTLPCDDHDDCPGPSLCIDRERGACLLACTRDSDCRGGYECKDVSDQRGGGKSQVCIH
jgi:hypothetical protein